MNPIDPLQLQRLVDGELDNEQVQQILAMAKSDPERWQEIAVGFVENQTWSRAFRKQEPNGSRRNSATAPPVVVSQPSATLSPEDDPSPGLKQTRVQSPNLSWLVMAASVLVSGMIGYMANQIQNRSLPGPLSENVAPVASPQVAKSLPGISQPERVSSVSPPQMTQADYHLEVPQEQFGDMGSAGPIAAVPLFAVNNKEQLKQLNQQRSAHAISPELLKRLSKSGYQMEQDVNYISGRLDDGRSFVVPVRTIRFMPGQ